MTVDAAANIERYLVGRNDPTARYASFDYCFNYFRSHYEAGTVEIDNYRVTTWDFDTGAFTQRRYTQAKVIDMVFFIEGGKT